MRHRLLDMDPSSYERHLLHSSERDWTETNCYVDVWVEVLHAFGFDPLAAAAFVLSSDFEGDQWTFLKYPPEDLRAAYGIEVAEINVWKPVLSHVVEHLGLGRLTTVEVDSYYLPDTAGTSYRTEHVKTTIVPQEVDLGERLLRYFHGAGYFELTDQDFAGVFRIGDPLVPYALPPYVESIRLPAQRPSRPAQIAVARTLTTEHLRRRPSANPVARMAERVQSDLPEIAERGLDYFHGYSFATLRQFGACAEIAAAFVSWLEHGTEDGKAAAAQEAFRRSSQLAKAVQFRLARVAVGKKLDVLEPFEDMAQAWERAMDALSYGYG